MPKAESTVCAAPVDVETELVSSDSPVCVLNFAEIYEKYFTFVWSIASHMGVDRAELDDVVQDIFITIHGRIRTIERPESLRSWVYGVIRRVVSGYHRTRRTRLIYTGTAGLEPEFQHPECVTPQQGAEQSEQAKLLWQLLNEIDTAKREVFVLAELEEMTAPEIAAAIDVPLNTVYSRLRAARQELEKGLRRHEARTPMRGRLCPT
jgi:RNA polymerase sigma-70 factor (ECF subfamily)